MEIARRILGENLILPKNVEAALGLVYPPDLMEKLKNAFNIFPDLAEKGLRDFNRRSFALLPGPPERMDVLALLELAEKLGMFRSKEDLPSHIRRCWGEVGVRPGWLWMKKVVAPESLSYGLRIQLELVAPDEIPNLAQAIWGLMIFIKVFKMNPLGIPCQEEFLGASLLEIFTSTTIILEGIHTWVFKLCSYDDYFIIISSDQAHKAGVVPVKMIELAE